MARQLGGEPRWPPTDARATRADPVRVAPPGTYLPPADQPPRHWYLELAWRLDEIESQAIGEQGAAVLPILAALRDLCLAYGDCRLEIDQQDRAHEAALQQERDLRREIQRALEALAEREPGAASILTSASPNASLAGQPVSAGDDPEPPGTARSSRFGALRRRAVEALGPRAERVAGHTRRTDALGADAASPELRQAGSIAAFCLGSFQVYVDDRMIAEWPGHKAVRVLQYLLLHRRSRVPKDVLFELFWPDHDPEACRRNLHQAIYSLRHTLRRHQPRVRYLLFEEECYFLNPEVEVWIDAEEFSERVGAGQWLEAHGEPVQATAEYGKAEALYQGHLLEEGLYEDWARVERERLRSQYRHAAGRLAEAHVEVGDYSAAIALCQKALSLDRCDEEAHRRLMTCYAAQGQRHLALRQFDVCAEALRADFDLVPDPQTRALHDRLKGGEARPATGPRR